MFWDVETAYRERCARAVEEILYVRSRDGKPRDDRASEIGSIPVPLGSRFQFSLDPLSRLARRVYRLAFVEQAKLHSAGGCNFAARIQQTGIRLFDPHCDGERRREKHRENKREREEERKRLTKDEARRGGCSK